MEYPDDFSSIYSYLYFLLILPLLRADWYVGLSKLVVSIRYFP